MGFQAQAAQKVVSPMPFWSDTSPSIQLFTGPIEDNDYTLPNVVVSGIPTGVTLVRVAATLKVRAIENLAANINYISGDCSIRVKKSTGAWGVDDVAAIDLPSNMWTIAASTRESGDVVPGDNDVKAEVDGNGTYNLRFEDVAIAFDSLLLNDIEVCLTFFFRS